MIAMTCILGLILLEHSPLEARHYTVKKPKLSYYMTLDRPSWTFQPPPSSQLKAAASSQAQSTHQIVRKKNLWFFFSH